MLQEFMKDTMPTTIIEENKPLINDLHPTMKPIRLLSRLIANSTKINEKVIDIFGGSGSTLIACEQLNRQCYMIELDEHYVQVIVKRFIDLVGTDKDVYCIRNREIIPYKELLEQSKE